MSSLTMSLGHWAGFCRRLRDRCRCQAWRLKFQSALQFQASTPRKPLVRSVKDVFLSFTEPPVQTYGLVLVGHAPAQQPHAVESFATMNSLMQPELGASQLPGPPDLQFEPDLFSRFCAVCRFLCCRPSNSLRDFGMFWVNHFRKP